MHSLGLATTPEERVRPTNVRSTADKTYRLFARGSGGLTLALMALIGLFLVIRSWTALHAAGFKFFTQSIWEPSIGRFGVWAALLGHVPDRGRSPS